MAFETRRNQTKVSRKHQLRRIWSPYHIWQLFPGFRQRCVVFELLQFFVQARPKKANFISQNYIVLNLTSNFSPSWLSFLFKIRVMAPLQPPHVMLTV